MNYKIIFIDIDNTLLDFDAYIEYALRTGLEHFNIGKYEDYMFDVFNNENIKLWKQLELGELTFQELKKIRFNNVLKALGFSFDGEIFENYFRDTIYNYAKQVDGAENLLKCLSSIAPIAVASNGPYEQQIHRMQISGLSKYISYYFISEKMGANKPSKLFFDRAFIEINTDNEETIKSEDCLMIGDSLTSDIKGGINAKMSTIYFNKHHEINNSDIHPDYTFDSLDEIKNFLSK